MRKALCVGIDCYENYPDLLGCVNDANSVKAALERNGDGSLNFDVKLLCATSESSYITRGELLDAIKALFKSESEVSVLYFAGHGAISDTGGFLCTSENARVDDGVSLNDIMVLASASKAQNKIILLDSCHSGSIGAFAPMTAYSIIESGTTLLAACGENEYSAEKNGQGVFTSLMVEALYGGAMNLLGEVSPGSIYSYIDKSLGSWAQRPVFKANIHSFVCLRKNIPPIDISKLRQIATIFPSREYEFPLDPTYEPDKHEADTKEVITEHEEIFSLLQQYTRLNLVTPVGETHMYYAAIHRKACKLTAQGLHYWSLVHNNLI